MKPMVPTLRKVFLVHGEIPGSTALAASIRSVYGIEAVVVEPDQSFDL
jgi:predicted metal-dependent RNase